MDKALVSNHEDFQSIKREVILLKNISHPFIVDLYEVFETDQFIYIISEYLSKGELYDKIVQSKYLSEEESAFYFYQILTALDYIHLHKIAHRDIKPENILVDWGGRVKLIDFGLSNLFPGDVSLRTSCGSPCYAPPEMIERREYDGRGTDIWSLGVTLYAMTTGKLA